MAGCIYSNEVLGEGFSSAALFGLPALALVQEVELGLLLQDVLARVIGGPVLEAKHISLHRVVPLRIYERRARLLVVPSAGRTLPLSELAGRSLSPWLILRQQAVVLLQALHVKIGVGLQEMSQLLVVLPVRLVLHLNYHVTKVGLLRQQVLDKADLVLVALQHLLGSFDVLRGCSQLGVELRDFEN